MLKQMLRLIPTLLFVAPLIMLPTVAVSDEEVMPYQYTACGYGVGIHDMKQVGGGSVFADGALGFEGPAWQCQNGYCYAVIVTEYDPLAGNYIGQYAMGYPGGQTNNFITLFKTAAEIGYWGRWPMDGFSFRYAK